MILIFGECYLTWRWGGESSHPEKVQSFLRGWEQVWITFSWPPCDYNHIAIISNDDDYDYDKYHASRMMAEPGSEASDVGDEEEASRLRWQMSVLSQNGVTHIIVLQEDFKADEYQVCTKNVVKCLYEILWYLMAPLGYIITLSNPLPTLI